MKIHIFFCALVLTLLPGISFSQERESADGEIDATGEEVQQHALGELPPVVMSTAKQAAPDVFFGSAESYWEDDFRVYKLTGRLFREVWTVYVRSDGKLLRKEADNQDS